MDNRQKKVYTVSVQTIKGFGRLSCMKKIRKLLCFVLVAVMALSAVACENTPDDTAGGIAVGTPDPDGGPYVMSYGDFGLTENEYRYIASYAKDAIVYNQQSYIYQTTGMQITEEQVLSMPVSEDGKETVADYIKQQTVQLAQQILIFEKLAYDAKLTITDESDIETINGYISDVEYAYGGTDLFEIALARLGFARSGIERMQKVSVLYELMFENRYGENGTAKISEETVKKYFTDNFYKYDGALYSYVDSDKGEYYKFEFSDAEIKEYFDKNYVKVCHVLYMTVDKKTGEKLGDDKVAEKKSAAESALQAIKNGEKTISDFEKENEDSNSEYVFTYDEMVENFEKAAFEMEAGEVRVVETEYGFHLMQKLEKTDDDLHGTVGEDGKTSGGIESEVIVVMSSSKIRNEALSDLTKLQNGELKKYSEESSDKSYYSLLEAGFVDKTETDYKTLVDIIAELEVGKYSEEEFPTEGTYIIRRLEFTVDEITSGIYSTIEEQLSAEAFNEYIENFYDEIQIDSELMKKFELSMLPALEEEFYS